MINTEFLPNAVQWSEGMLLSPQHFQQNDIHAQAMLHQRLASLSPHAWGVRTLKLDVARLADGFVKITECDAVMPDGLPLVFRAVTANQPLNLKVDDKCVVNGRPVRVFLTIPPRAGALDVPSTSIRRYTSLQGKETLDEVTGIGDVVVERQCVNIALFAEDDVPSGYPALPLLEVVRDANGAVVLAPYHPPMFRIDTSAFLKAQGLQQRFIALRNDMWEKLRELVGTSDDDGPESIAMLGTEARMHLRAARDVAACLPLIDTILVDPQASPAQAWSAMAQIVGRMAAIGSNPRPLSMDPYRHADCIEQFQEALAFVNRKLGLVNTDWDSQAFIRVNDGMFTRRLPEDSTKRVYIELRTSEGQSAGDMLKWLRDARIASEELLPVLRQRRMPGALVEKMGPGEQSSLGLRSDALIFAVSSQSLEMPQGMVDSFRPGRSIVVQGDPSLSPVAIILHHPRQSAGQPARHTAGHTSTSGHAANHTMGHSVESGDA